MELQVLDDPGEVLLDPSPAVLVVPEFRVRHLGLQDHATFLLFADPEVDERLIQSDPERSQFRREVLHVNPRGTA